MRHNLKYGPAVRAISMLFYSCLIFGLAVVVASAQTVNWGPSVTSLGFGGSNHPGGVAPSVTSLGFGHGNAIFVGSPHPGLFTQPGHRDLDGVRHRRPYYPVWGGYYAYPVLADPNDAYPSDQTQDAEDEYRGGPTIFDRRGDGRYAPPSGSRYDSSRAPEVEPITAQSASADAPNQPQTVLVFKDGHQMEIDNYAILGGTLYDFSGGKHHKIALSELDLKATIQGNDDRGVDFELPTSRSN